MKILIAGQGLAGTVLALELISRGVDFTIADPGFTFSSTRVAAGIIRPVTGRHLAKTYQSDKAVPLAFRFYDKASSLTGVNFIHSKDVLQLFADHAAANDWFGRASEAGYADYIGEFLDRNHQITGLKKHNGGVLLKQCGYLETGKFLDSCKLYFTSLGKFKAVKVEAAGLVEKLGEISFDGESFDKVILCDGVSAAALSPFSWLPFRPVKGEICDFEAKGLDESYIVNHGKFILPLGNGQFRTGSTYNWNRIDNEATPETKDFFENWLQGMLDVPFKITGHVAGIRPAVVDRKPLIGMHPEKKWLGIFNGLGSKGVMLAPYCAAMLADLILDDKEPDSAVSINRFIENFGSENQ